MTKNHNSELGGMLCFVFVFFSIFGVKITYIDLAIIAPSSIVILYLMIRRSTKFDRRLLITAGLIGILLIYQTTIQFLYQNFDYLSLLRLFRAILSCVLFSIMIGSNLFSRNQILNSVFYSLLLHVILINAAAIFDPLNYFLVTFSGNDRIKPFRASGFLAGFDIAGLLCLLGLVMLLLKTYVPKSSLKLIIFYSAFVFGCFFTSRVSMALVVIFFVFFFISNLFDRNTKFCHKFLFAPILAFFGYIFIAEYFIPIVEVTFSLGAFDVSDALRDEILSRHAAQSTDAFLWSDMLYLPKGFSAIFFGTGIDELASDIGYVKDIFRYGLVGLGFSFFVYYYMYCIGRDSLILPSGRRYLSMLRIVFILIFVLTFKNNYFFTRAIFPALLFLVCIPMARSQGLGTRLS